MIKSWNEGKGPANFAVSYTRWYIPTWFYVYFHAFGRDFRFHAGKVSW